MSVDVKEIRKKYPKPIRFISRHAYPHVEDYCVGGALCQFMEVPTRFPGFTTLYDCLSAANPQLTSTRCSFFSLTITSENDKGNFEMAWEYLGEALTWKPVSLEEQT